MDKLDFGCFDDSDGSYCNAEEEEVFGTQAVDYSSLELLQQHQDNGRGAPRGRRLAPTPINGATSGGIAANSTQGWGSEAGPRCSGILRSKKGARRDIVGFNVGVRLYTNPTAPARERRRQTGRRGIQLGHRHDDNLHSPCDVEDIGGVDPPLHNLAMRTTGRGSERHGGQRQRRRTWLWMDKQLRETLAAVDDGMSMRKATTTFNIPYSSFREWCYGIRNTRKKGPPTTLSPEEDELVKYLIQMCDRGYGLSPTALRMKVYDITQSMWTSFQNGIPSNGWMRWWKRRYPALTLRVSQALESAQAKGLCEENVTNLYENLQHLYSMHEYAPDRI